MRRGALLVALVFAVLPGRADAFVRRLNSAGNPVFWRESCVPVTIYLNGFDDRTKVPANGGLDVAAIVKSITAAAHAWSTDAVSCSAAGDGPSIEIVPTLAPLDAKPPPVGYDARNIIVFRTTDWLLQDSDALAHTNVIPSNDDGHILDADIEINAATPGQVWLSLDPGVVPPPDPPHQTEGTRYFDLQAVLTHEFGHLLGLMHACYRSVDGPQLRDAETGDLIPNCVQGMDTTSVMDPTIEPAQSLQRTLFDDDDSAACTIYAPLRSATCALDTPQAGCAIAPQRRSSRTALPVGVAVAVSVVLIALARRSRRARVSDPGRARA